MRISFPLTFIGISVVIGVVQLMIVMSCASIYVASTLFLLGVIRLLCLCFTLGNAKVNHE